ARPATEYRLNVSYSSQPSDKGGAVITIKVDENAIEIEQDVAVIAAPAIEGFDFDLAQAIRGKKGSFGDYMVNIVTAAQIETVELRGSVFEPIIGGPDFKIPGIDESLSAALRAAGFIHERKALQEGESGDRIQLNFAREFMNALPDGSYSITIIATDNEGKASTAVMNITVSDDPLTIEQASAVRYTTATISAAINKAGEGYQLLFRKKGATEWTDAAATEAGAYLTAHLTGLDNSTDYEFIAKAADYESAVLTFTTRTPAQLPNAGFEEWGNEGNVLIPGADVSGLFWDTGNHGSMKMSKLVTEKESTLKHSGDFSAALKSQFVGVGALGKFAAGNIFAGKYLETIGTNGKLGWGRDFTEMPSKVRAWVKYTPVAITHVGKGTPDGVNKGDMDRGVIYVALLDDDRSKDKEGWPVVVNTATQEFFKPGEDPRVIAYGEIVFTEATAGDGLVEVTFDIDYRNDKIPAKIVFVAAASKYGDYFTGGAGSTMYLDDIELIYE
ncbi:MAG: PCMD domain-containing protein, partial [Muribaculaceae bacterium]|nr:PCMD domain-containing protein [Muribaculaceae bacterium]